MPKRRLSDLTPGQKKSLGFAGVVQVGLAVAALVDIWRRPAARVRGNRIAWSMACGINFLGPAAWFLFGRRR